MQSLIQSQGLTLPSKVEVSPFVARVNTKKSCMDPFGQHPETGDSDKFGLYVDESPP